MNFSTKIFEGLDRRNPERLTSATPGKISWGWPKFGLHEEIWKAIPNNHKAFITYPIHYPKFRFGVKRVISKEADMVITAYLKPVVPLGEQPAINEAID